MESAINRVFDTPELRLRIAQFVTLRDALSCVLVSKDWADSFSFAVWHTIDFDLQGRFILLDDEVISKYGSRIRSVKNIKDNIQVQLINNPAINRLAELTMAIGKTARFQACCFETLGRNSVTLKDIRISKSPQASNIELFFPIEGAFRNVGTGARPCLSSLTFQGMTITRAAISSLLMALPVLSVLDLTSSTILPSILSEIYEHRHMSTLVASTSQIFGCTSTPEQPSLFAHFPKLMQWRVCSESSSSTKVSPKDIKSEVTLHCPNLWFLYLDVDGPTAGEIITKGFKSLWTICVRQDQLSPQLILAILRHSSELTNFTTFLQPQRQDDDDGELEEIEVSQAPGWAIQQIPQQCKHLRSLVLPEQEIDIEDMEMSPWSCRFLRDLHIRIRGLNTKEKVDRTIQLWLEKREKKSEAAKPNEDDDDYYGGYNDDATPQADVSALSIEERVADHLVKLKYLNKIGHPLALKMNRFRGNPLEVPLIRRRISEYMAAKDAIACALVCKDWTDDFVNRIWQSIDVNRQSRFLKLSTEVISEHGHRIRAIHALQKLGELEMDVIRNPSICRLTTFSIYTYPGQGNFTYYFDILQQNIKTLREIKLTVVLHHYPET
ncbi:hypothetical protein BGX21_011052, partial [Mortierella sp. AD011]